MLDWAGLGRTSPDLAGLGKALRAWAGLARLGGSGRGWAALAGLGRVGLGLT